jgi:hypothetical protein
LAHAHAGLQAAQQCGQGGADPMAVAQQLQNQELNTDQAKQNVLQPLANI